jgi:hypothetical protein
MNTADTKLGMNLRALLESEIALKLKDADISSYDVRSKFVDYIESRLMECDWVSMSNGTTFEKTFVPTRK